MNEHTAGHRAAAPSSQGHQRRRPRLDVTTVLAVLLPLVTVAALALVRPDPFESAPVPPTDVELTRASVVCPSAGPESFVASTSGEQGRVAVRLGDEESRARVAPDQVVDVAGVEVAGGDGPLVATGREQLAPGLLAGRFDTPLAAADCRAPLSDQWFTGAGAGARHGSVLELVNPDSGRAVVETIVHGHRGVIDAPDLRGVAVPGGTSVRIDLSETLPRRGELALHVTTSRGRIGASVLDRVDELGAGAQAEDWLPAQSEPLRSNLLLGLPEGEGDRTLVIANGGEDETRATVQIVTEDSVFTPSGVEDVVVAPGSVQRVDVGPILEGERSEGALGLLVEAAEPVTTTIRSFVDGDVSHAATPDALTQPTSAIVPAGDKQVLLAGADTAGTVTVRAVDGEGRPVVERRVDVVPDRGYAVDLPPAARLVTLTPRNAEVSASVLVTGDGATLVRVRPQQRRGVVADVRPGLP